MNSDIPLFRPHTEFNGGEAETGNKRPRGDEEEQAQGQRQRLNAVQQAAEVANSIIQATNKRQDTENAWTVRDYLGRPIQHVQQLGDGGGFFSNRPWQHLSAPQLLQTSAPQTLQNPEQDHALPHSQPHLQTFTEQLGDLSDAMAPVQEQQQHAAWENMPTHFGITPAHLTVEGDPAWKIWDDKLRQISAHLKQNGYVRQRLVIRQARRRAPKAKAAAPTLHDQADRDSCSKLELAIQQKLEEAKAGYSEQHIMTRY